MSDPVIMDDGGSTRVRQLINGGVTTNNPDPLLSLIDVALDAGTGEFQSTGTVPGPFDQVSVLQLDDQGTPTILGPYGLNPNDKVEIFSHNNQRVKVSISNDNQKNATILIHAVGQGGNPPEKNQPYVECRGYTDASGFQQHRYEITNAGPIRRVNVPGPGDISAENFVYTSLTFGPRPAPVAAAPKPRD